MELTSKQRAQLRGMANGLDTIVQIGKDGIGDNLVQQANAHRPGGLPGAGQTHPKRRRAGHWDQICTLSREP